MEDQRLAPLRPRLMDVLSGEARVVVVHGPRLSGKTTLLRQWLAESRPGSDVRLGVVDPAPGVTRHDYWSELVRALHAAHGPPAPVPDEHTDPFDLAKKLIGMWEGQLTLVLDDVHLVGGAREAVRELVAMSAAAGFRMILATTITAGWSGPAGPRDAMALIAPEDLLLTDGEIAAAAAAAGVSAAGRGVSTALAEDTGRMAGFVAAGVSALRGSGSSLRGSDSSGDGPWSSRRSPPEVIRAAVERLVEQLIADDSVSSDQREYLLRTVVADPLTGPAAAVAAGESDRSGVGDAREDRLPMLERCGLAVRQPDAPEPTWRYPEPIRQSLLRRARETSPEQVRETLLALVDHWLARDRPHTAFVHAIDAEDWDLVLAILRDHWQTLYTADFLRMDRDLERIPASVLETEPLFATIRRMHSGFSAPKYAPVPEVAVDTGPDMPEDADRLIRVIALRIDGRFADAAELAAPLIDAPLPDVGSAPRTDVVAAAFAQLHVGLSLVLAGRFDEAVQVLRRAHRLGAGSFVERDAAGKLTLVNAILGNLADAETWSREERRHPALVAESEAVVRPAGMIGTALGHLDRLELDAALDLVADLGRPSDREELWGFTLYVYGQLALTSGTAADGLRYVEHQLRRFPGRCGNGAVTGPLLDAVRADLNLALGRDEAADELVGESTHPLTAAARARVRLCRGDDAGALEIVWKHHGDLACTARDSVELSLIGAAASLSTGSRDEARRYLQRAVTKSRLTGLVRPFTTLPRGVLEQLAELGPNLPIRPHEVHTGFPPRVRSPAEAISLTGREEAILRSLASEATIVVIAADHFVSVNTVKTQLRSLYRKLGVRSRTEAVDLARRLGLL